MTVLDANAVIATFAGEPASAEVRPLLLTADAKIATANVVEVYDKLMRLRAMPRNEVSRRFDVLKRVRRLRIVSLDEDIAIRAGELRARNYDRQSRPLSLADCVAAATAEQLEEALATSDQGLGELARGLGLDVVALPDSSGRLP